MKMVWLHGKFEGDTIIQATAIQETTGIVAQAQITIKVSGKYEPKSTSGGDGGQSSGEQQEEEYDGYITSEDLWSQWGTSFIASNGIEYWVKFPHNTGENYKNIPLVVYMHGKGNGEIADKGGTRKHLFSFIT